MECWGPGCCNVCVRWMMVLLQVVQVWHCIWGFCSRGAGFPWGETDHCGGCRIPMVSKQIHSNIQQLTCSWVHTSRQADFCSECQFCWQFALQSNNCCVVCAWYRWAWAHVFTQNKLGYSTDDLQVKALEVQSILGATKNITEKPRSMRDMHLEMKCPKVGYCGQCIPSLGCVSVCLSLFHPRLQTLHEWLTVGVPSGHCRACGLLHLCRFFLSLRMFSAPYACVDVGNESAGWQGDRHCIKMISIKLAVTGVVLLQKPLPMHLWQTWNLHCAYCCLLGTWIT